MGYWKWAGIAGAVCVVLLGGVNAWADDAAECGKLYLAKQYKQAFPICIKTAEQGDVVSQFTLGVMYANGRGVKKDDVEAVKWYRKAAEQGLADAQGNLGVMYANGWGVKQDFAEGEKWTRKEAEQGDAEDQFWLGVTYSWKKNFAEAEKWYRKAAEQGLAQAQRNIGVMYANGQGVLQSGAAAADWYYKAGLSYLKQGKRDDALTCADRIKKQGNIPNAFLTDRLLNKIYGGKVK